MRGRRLLLPSLAVAAVLSLALGLASATAGSTALSAEEELGRSIFFDERLSINQNQSCATCHDPMAGWVGPDGAINAAGSVYEGSIPGRFGDRKPPSSAYATQSPILHMPAEGFFVGAWVSLWHPVEMLFYEWLPLYEEERKYARLLTMPVEYCDLNGQKARKAPA